MNHRQSASVPWRHLVDSGELVVYRDLLVEGSRMGREMLDVNRLPGSGKLLRVGNIGDASGAGTATK